MNRFDIEKGPHQQDFERMHSINSFDKFSNFMAGNGPNVCLGNLAFYYRGVDKERGLFTVDNASIPG